MKSKKKISVIVPCYNEQQTILKIIRKIINAKPKDKEIIIVNDCSTDQTKNILGKLKLKFKNKNKIKIINHKKNFGKGKAIITGLKKVTGNIVIIQDADLEYDPKEYQKLIKPIIDGSYKVVYGSRVLGRKGKIINHSLAVKFRIITNYFLTKYSNILNNQSLTDAHTCYKVFDYNIIKNLNLTEEDFAFCPEVTTKLGNKNFKILEVPISYKGRTYKQGKKIGIYDGLRALFVIIKYKFFMD